MSLEQRVVAVERVAPLVLNWSEELLRKSLGINLMNRVDLSQ